jgi:hypothetical protein
MKGKVILFVLKTLCIFPIVLLTLLHNLRTTAAEEDIIINRDINILHRIPDDDTQSSSSLLSERDARYRAFVSRQLIHPSRLVHAETEGVVHLAVIASNVNTTAVANGDDDQAKKTSTK